jgi:hypothetical protein
MHVLMTASSNVVTMRIWLNARYALHCGIRSKEMILVMLRVSPQEEGSYQGDVVCSYNTMVEMFVSVQRACQVITMAQKGPFARRDVETPR